MKRLLAHLRAVSRRPVSVHVQTRHGLVEIRSWDDGTAAGAAADVLNGDELAHVTGRCPCGCLHAGWGDGA